MKWKLKNMEMLSTTACVVHLIFTALVSNLNIFNVQVTSIKQQF
jgi:hypothetical protein